MLYDKVIELCRPYLSLATEAFINRQIFTNMKLRQTSDLSETHLYLLARWCFHSGQEIMGENRAREMAKKIMKLEEMDFLRKLFKPQN